MGPPTSVMRLIIGLLSTVSLSITRRSFTVSMAEGTVPPRYLTDNEGGGAV